MVIKKEKFKPREAINNSKELMGKEIELCEHVKIIRRYSQFDIVNTKKIRLDTYINLQNQDLPKLQHQCIKISCECGNHIIFDLD